ncbi:proteasome assembly chaperone family protein [Candidatus Micrarchaeota archaeon]|nr:proteasome assembly chaperone family protein [Candidatus Micrarchaeota archaeon]MBD3417967.1 proteasome assembly chaperone family protein [Candidatus Micrarchaeota archaeon]
MQITAGKKRGFLMDRTIINEKKKVSLENPVMVTGLPGIGLVGQVAAKYIIKKLKGEKIADVYSPHFPHQVLMSKKGGMRLLKNTVYLVKAKKRDLLVVIGDVQAVSSVGQYEVADKILDYMEEKGVKLIITIGGYSTGKVEKSRRVFGSANNKKLKKDYEKKGIVFGETRGSIVGVAGLLPGLAKLRKLDGICIMGETHGSYVDHTSAKNVVEKLSELLEFEIEISELEKEAHTREKVIKKIEKEVEHQMAGAKKDITYIR